MKNFPHHRNMNECELNEFLILTAFWRSQLRIRTNTCKCLWARLHPTTAQRNTLLIKVKRTHQHQTGHSWLKMPPQKINWIDKKYCVKKRGWVCLPSREIGRRDRRLASTCCPPLWFKNGGVFKHRSFLLKRTQAGLCLQGSVMGEFTLASLRT